MEEYKFLLDIAIILAMTKSFSLVSKKFNMPPVVGALIADFLQKCLESLISQVHILQGSFYAGSQNDFIYITRLKFYRIC